MSAPLTLDIFRKNDFMYLSCYIYYHEDRVIGIPFYYDSYFNSVLELFISQLKEFENSILVPKAFEPLNLVIFSNFFSVIEQFISTTYQIVYFSNVSSTIPSQKESQKLFRCSYTKTLESIFTDSKISKEIFKTSKIYNMLSEMEDCRNYILHGNTGNIRIEKTNFPKYPLTINIDDIMEQLNIIVNIINFFRYLFPVVDLMPNVLIRFPKTFLFKKLDEYFYQFLVPYYMQILSKQGFTSNKKFELFIEPCSTIQPNIAKNIKTFIKAVPEEKFKFMEKSKVQTDLFSRTIKNIVDLDDVERMSKEKLFKLPNFCRTE